MIESFAGMRRASSNASPNDMIALENLSVELLELKLTVEGLERERDFYFRKLTNIEDIVQDSNNKIYDQIRNILYNTEVNSCWLIFNFYVSVSG